MIDENGENLGVMLTAEAMAQANDLGLDLVVGQCARVHGSVVIGKAGGGRDRRGQH